MKFSLRSVIQKGLLLLAAVFPLMSSAQLTGLAGYYSSPLDIPILLSANFAEVRTNHFHSGIDIKTQGVEGKPLYAAADGYISRIGIAPSGFGRVIYISHPNGTTTVYAHMQKFTPEVERFIDSERYRQQKHNVDVYVQASVFPVKKGDYIGNAGNSGSSMGPHLHFEVRESATQRPINILTHNIFDITDDIPPQIVRLHYIEADIVDGVPVYSTPVTLQTKSAGRGRYILADTAAVEVGPRGYFVLETTDRKNNTHNTMGVYRVSEFMDGEQIFTFSLDGFLFSETRYVNSMCQYNMQRGSRNELIKLFIQDNNKLPVYGRHTNRGMVVPADHSRHLLRIEAEDDNGNVSQIEFTVKRRENDVRFWGESSLSEIKVDCTKAFNRRFDEGRVSLSIPANSLYENIYLKYDVSEGIYAAAESKASVKRYSPVYSIHTGDVPLHKRVDLSIAPLDEPEDIRKHLCLAVLSTDGTTYSYAGGAYSGGEVKGSVSVFGRYCVVADTIPPVVTPSFTQGQDLSQKNSISFTIKDNFSGIASFYATIDGQWIPFEHTVSSGTITHFFNTERHNFNGSNHELMITVTDNAGNKTVIRRNFVK